MDINRATKYAKSMHDGQYRMHGAEYIVHPIRVKEILKEKGIKDEEYLITALFHDLIEDTDASKEDIIKYGNEKIYQAVKILSKEKDYVMDEYISNIKSTEMTKLVKLADRISNLEDAHCTEDLNFMKHYIEETGEYYIPLSKGTIFEDDMQARYDELKSYYSEYKK